ncbi:DoxX family protein [Cohnella nanjingensis]|uniref:DoxX family protein n=1 Tax=Cohnella nanjingensis TaxID=1387779 RepID=A0A7X0RMK3_9BACL|nr:DoxX family protein [Cohnella nanjingensis]MBB6670235.1 DoxX family protein [Cohnella nanjingensis]
MTVLSIVLQILLILYYLFSGTAKVVGAKYWSEMFQHLGLPQWFRVVTGFVQLAGAAVLIVGYWYAGAIGWAGIWLGVTMVAAFFVHLKAKDPIGKSSPALVFATINIVLIVIHADELIHPFA